MYRSRKTALILVALLVTGSLLMNLFRPGTTSNPEIASSDKVSPVNLREHAVATVSANSSRSQQATTPQTNMPDTEGMTALVWPEFKYPHVIESAQSGGEQYFVGTHLLLTVMDPGDVDTIRSLADGLKDASLHLVTGRTWRISWKQAGIRQFLMMESFWNREAGDIAIIDRDFIIRSLVIPDDPDIVKQYALDVIEAQSGWDVRSDADEITVAVVDSGIDLNNDDLSNNIRISPTESANGLDDDGNGYVDDTSGWDFVDNDKLPEDEDGHGSAMASIIGAEGNNGSGIAGVAWNVQLLPLKVLDENGLGTTSDVFAALDYVKGSGTSVVNASFGHTGYSRTEELYFSELRDAGIWVAAASGNDGNNVADLPVYPAALSLENILSIGASSRDNSAAAFSNYGTGVDIFAPGVDVLCYDKDGSQWRVSGTSPATAFVSGALALLLAEYPDLSFPVGRSRLIDRARYSYYLEQVCAADGVLSLAHSLAGQPSTGPEIQYLYGEGEYEYRNQNIFLDVGFSSYGKPSFAWYKDGALLPGKTDKRLELSLLDAAVGGSYRVEVSDKFGSVLSGPIVVGIRPPVPTVTLPQSWFRLNAGETLTLEVEVGGLPPFSFEWYHEGTLIGITDSRSIQFPNVGGDLSGNYTVIVRNNHGYAESGKIYVEVITEPDIDWFTPGVFGPYRIVRVGDLYYSVDNVSNFTGRWSTDLIHWEVVSDHIGDVTHAEGYYWSLNGYRELHRSTDGVHWELFLSLPTDAGSQLAVGNGKAVISWGSVYVVDLQTKGVEKLDLTGAGHVTYFDGHFELGVDNQVYTSSNGLDWQLETTARPLVVYKDTATGKYIGMGEYINGSHYYISSNLIDWRHINHPDQEIMAFTFATGRLFTSTLCFDIGTETFIWQTEQPNSRICYDDGLFQCTYEDGEYILQNLLDGTTSELIFGSLLREFLYSNHQHVFVMADELFFMNASSLARLDFSGLVQEIVIPQNMDFVSANSDFALFYNASDNRFYRMSANMDFRESGLLLETANTWDVQADGTWWHVVDGDVLRISDDGLTWYDVQMPFSMAISGYDGIIIGFHHDGNPANAITDVYKLNIDTYAWDPVASLQGDIDYEFLEIHPFAASKGFLVNFRTRTWFSPDGVNWQPSLLDPQGHLQFQFAEDLFFKGPGTTMASADGINWFYADIPNYPLIQTSDLLYKDDALARADGTRLRNLPSMRLSGNRVQSAPASWELTVSPDDSKAVAAIHLFENGAIKESIYQKPFVFDLVKDTPGWMECSVKVEYLDGVVAQTQGEYLYVAGDFHDSIWHVTGYQHPVEPAMGLYYHPFMNGFMAEERQFANFFFSYDGNVWEPMQDGQLPNLRLPEFYQLATGESVIFNIAAPWDPLEGYLKQDPVSDWQTLQLPDTPDDIFARRYIHQGNLYWFSSNGTHFVLENQQWKQLPDAEIIPADFPQGLTNFKVYTDPATPGLRLLKVGASGYYVTSDFMKFNLIPTSGNWKHVGGLWFQHLSHPVLALASDASGDLSSFHMLPVMAQSIHSIDEQTIFATGEDGIHWIGQIGKNLMPLRKVDAELRNVMRTETEVLLFFEDGSIRRFSNHDLIISNCEVNEVVHGQPNSVKGSFDLINAGILDIGDDISITTNLSLLPISGNEAALELGTLDIPLGDLPHGVPVRHEFEVFLPDNIRLGDYRISITLDPINSLREANEQNNQAISDGFVYDPKVSLDLYTIGPGWIEASHLSSELPYGTVVSLGAIGFDGYKFAGWSGSNTSRDPILEIHMDGSKAITAHFLSTSLLSTYPDVRIKNKLNTYAEQGSPTLEAVHLGWTYLDSSRWAWFMHITVPVFYLPDAGWVRRIPGTQFYYLIDNHQWLFYDANTRQFVLID